MPSRRDSAPKILPTVSDRKRVPYCAHFVAQNGVRVDTGVEEGSAISPFYDSMAAKFIAHGRSRAEAARKLTSALEDAPLLGLRSNQRFLAQLLRSREFDQSLLDTHSLDAWMEAETPLFERDAPSTDVWALAAALFADLGNSGEWFWSGNAFGFSLELECSGERKGLRYSRSSQGEITVSFAGEEAQVALIDSLLPEIIFEADGVRRRAIAIWSGTSLHLSVAGSSFVFNEAGQPSRRRRLRRWRQDYSASRRPCYQGLGRAGARC